MSSDRPADRPTESAAAAFGITMRGEKHPDNLAGGAVAGPTIPVFIIRRWDPFFIGEEEAEVEGADLSLSPSRSFLLACLPLPPPRCHTRRSNVSNARFKEGPGAGASPGESRVRLRE